MILDFNNVSFTYETMSKPLLEDLSVHFPPGWTGVIGANGVGKTTLLMLAAGILVPQKGSVQIPGHALYCSQRTDSIPEMLNDLIAATDGVAYTIKGRLGITNDWPGRWHTLSHGERKRAQIGVALWRQLDILVIDEPTNHLDTEARAMVVAALRSFKGIGLLVSHDRDLLDGLCRQCLFIEPPNVIMRPGGYTRASQQAKKDDESVRRQYDIAKRNKMRLEQEVVQRKQAAATAQQQRSKSGLAKKDHDARAKKDLARVSGKDGVAGRRLRQLAGRSKQTREKYDIIKSQVKKTFNTGIWIEGSRSKRDTLVKIPAGAISLGENRQLLFPDLVLKPTDRVALTGLNGTGKSTLVRHILACSTLPGENLTYLPQEIDSETSTDILHRVRNLAADKLGHIMTVVSRLGSRPYRLLETARPSPGEIRKLLLALGIAQMPHLIIMDEPTNHLDLVSIECLENALADCPCGLLLVSHDRIFLERLTRSHWHIGPKESQPDSLILTIES